MKFRLQPFLFALVIVMLASACGGQSGAVAEEEGVAEEEAEGQGQSLAEYRKSLPPKPIDLAAEVSKDGVRITWNVLMECPVYLVYRATGPTVPDDDSNMRLIGASTEPEFWDHDPPKGTLYYAVVSMNAVSSQSPRSRLVELLRSNSPAR